MAKEENIILPVLALGAAVLIFSGGGDNTAPPHVTITEKYTPTQFIVKFWPDAVYAQKQTSIPAIVTISQAILESGYGNHAPGNNYFGIKDSASWTGPTTIQDTTEVINNQVVHIKALFRAYPDARASFVDHGKFFLQNSRYHKALQYVNDPGKFVQQISLPVLNPGYATDPNYSAKLFAIMKIVLQILQNEKMI